MSSAWLDDMRALLPERVGDVDLHEWYAAGWLERGGVRVNFVSSIDGAAAANGRSAGLQTPGDNQVFTALRDLADVVLVGAGTALAEDYHRPQPVGERLERRHAYDLPDALRLALLTRTGRGLSADRRLFADTGAPPPLIFTTETADVSAVQSRAEIVRVGQDDVELRRVADELSARGLTRVLCEGGPTIFGRLASADVLDELCLSLSPLLVGPGSPRIISGEQWADGPRPLRLTGLLEDDGALFLRLGVDRA